MLISGGFSGPYEHLVPEFERTTGMMVATGSGSSQGTGPQTIAAQLARGVPADVVILSREGLMELIAANRIAGGTDVDLARTPIGVAVRAGADKPDAGTVEAFKQVVLKAKLVAVPSSTSGIFLTVLSAFRFFCFLWLTLGITELRSQLLGQLLYQRKEARILQRCNTMPNASQIVLI